MNSETCVLSAMNLMIYYQYGRYSDVVLWKQKPSAPDLSSHAWDICEVFI
jgi:hypothetical protein